MPGHSKHGHFQEPGSFPRVRTSSHYQDVVLAAMRMGWSSASHQLRGKWYGWIVRERLNSCDDASNCWTHVSEWCFMLVVTLVWLHHLLTNVNGWFLCVWDCRSQWPYHSYESHQEHRTWIRFLRCADGFTHALGAATRFQERLATTNKIGKRCSSKPTEILYIAPVISN